MRFIAKESSAAETIGKQWMADKCGYRDGVRNMNTDVGAELRSRLRARSGSATGCHRQVIHYRPPCGARNFFARCRFAKFRPLHVSRLAFFRHRRRTFVGTLFTSISSCGIRCIGSLPPCGARNFFARCRFAKFRPLHVSRPAFFRRRRRQGVKPLSNQNKRALLRSARRIGIRSRLRARSGSATGVHRTVIHYRPPCGARNFFARCRFAKFRPLHVSRLAFFRHRRQGAKPRSNPFHIKREKHFCEVLFSFGSRIGIRTPTYRVRVCCATVTQFGCICF